MNLNNMGAGRKLLNQILMQGKLRTMGWSPQQQQETLAKQKNPHNPKSRPTNHE
jgi:hypothetical protein